MRPILGIGWDVGGWLGNKQAVAVALQDGRERRWPAQPVNFDIASLHRDGPTLLALIRRCWPDAPDDTLARYRVVLAIDAPLGLPLAWQQLFAGQLTGECLTQREIDSPLAYRETDRWVQRTFGKKPLSASFDRLGNGASVARWHVNRWGVECGLQVAPPRPAGDDEPVAIEVYPALAKDPRTRVCVEPVVRLLPPCVTAGTDPYDAAICAIHALAFSLGGACDLPLLVDPPGDLPAATLSAEGWIYAVTPEWLAGGQAPRLTD